MTHSPLLSYPPLNTTHTINPLRSLRSLKSLISPIYPIYPIYPPIYPIYQIYQILISLYIILYWIIHTPQDPPFSHSNNSLIRIYIIIINSHSFPLRIIILHKDTVLSLLLIHFLNKISFLISLPQIACFLLLILIWNLLLLLHKSIPPVLPKILPILICSSSRWLEISIKCLICLACRVCQILIQLIIWEI